jgi:hypothetical protein
VNRVEAIPPAGEAGDDEEGEDDAAKLAQEREEERDQARQKIQEMEEGEPPADLADWPDDAAKYETFGGPEGEHGYHEGPEEEKLGPSSLRHHKDGRVTVEEEDVGDPDEYKSDPIPGEPTDPDAALDLTSKKIRDSRARDLEGDGRRRRLTSRRGRSAVVLVGVAGSDPNDLAAAVR